MGSLPGPGEINVRNRRLTRRRWPDADGCGVVELEDQLPRTTFELIEFVAEASAEAPFTVGEGKLLPVTVVPFFRGRIFFEAREAGAVGDRFYCLLVGPRKLGQRRD